MKRFAVVLVALAVSASAMAGGGEGKGKSHRDHADRPSEAEILETVQDESPERYDRLIALRDRDPGRYHEAMRHIGRALAVREVDPKAEGRQQDIMALKDQLHDLAKGYDRLDPKAQAARKAEIVSLANQLFDLKMTELEARLKLAEKREAEGRARLEAHRADKAKIVNERVERLLSGEPRGEGKGRRHGRGDDVEGGL
jgi:hypothetical protein